MKTGFSSLLLAAAVITACDEPGTESGVGGSRSIADLSAEEARALCEWGIGIQADPGTYYDCGGDGEGTNVGSVDGCVEHILWLPDYCGLITVWEMESCFEERADNPCGDRAFGMCHNRPPCR